MEPDSASHINMPSPVTYECACLCEISWEKVLACTARFYDLSDTPHVLPNRMYEFYSVYIFTYFLCNIHTLVRQKYRNGHCYRACVSY